MMSSVQNKKTSIRITLSSDDEDETIDSVIKHKNEFPKLPRELWLRILSFNFGEDPEKYTDIKKNRAKRKKYIKSINAMQKNIYCLEGVIKDDMNKLRPIELEMIELNKQNNTQNKTNIMNAMKKMIEKYEKYIYDEKKDMNRWEDKIMED